MTGHRWTGAEVEAWIARHLEAGRAEVARLAEHNLAAAELQNLVVSLDLKPFGAYVIPDDVLDACPDPDTRAMVDALLQRVAATPLPQENQP